MTVKLVVVLCRTQGLGRIVAPSVGQKFIIRGIPREELRGNGQGEIKSQAWQTLINANASSAGSFISKYARTPIWYIK